MASLPVAWMASTMADGAANSPKFRWFQRQQNVCSCANQGMGKKKKRLRRSTRPFYRHQLLLDICLDLGDPLKLVQGARDILGAPVTGHGHREECLFQVSAIRVYGFFGGFFLLVFLVWVCLKPRQKGHNLKYET
jgi:hypothetical protein